MGALFSAFGSDKDIQCEDRLTIADDEFVLSVDAQAFEYHMLSNLPNVRITTLSATTGKWGQMSDKYTREKPYVDDHVRIWPHSKNDGHAVMEVRKTTTMLIKMPRTRVKTILCRTKTSEPVLYIRMHLKKVLIDPGTYLINHDVIVKNDNTLVIVATPDTTRVTSVQGLADKNFDPNLTLFMAASLPKDYKDE